MPHSALLGPLISQLETLAAEKQKMASLVLIVPYSEKS